MKDRMASPTGENIALISRVFAEFRKDACLPGDDRISESFIKAGLTLLGSVKPDKRCEYCDGTGDVHSIDGEWRGRCICSAGELSGN